jgi:uncharacterized protein
VIFIDTSALVKRYVSEAGSDVVMRLMAEDLDWAASELARTEARTALCRRGPEGALGKPVQVRLALDWDRFLTVPVDPECLALAADIGCRLGIRTLDAVHLAAVRRLPSQVRFLSFDQRQLEAAASLGLNVVRR